MPRTPTSRNPIEQARRTVWAMLAVICAGGLLFLQLRRVLNGYAIDDEQFKRCRADYAEAATAQDTGLIDDRQLVNTHGRTRTSTTCGALRRAGRFK